jgi:hypothetical protein
MHIGHPNSLVNALTVMEIAWTIVQVVINKVGQQVLGLLF